MFLTNRRTPLAHVSELRFDTVTNCSNNPFWWFKTMGPVAATVFVITSTFTTEDVAANPQSSVAMAWNW